ncbi:MAG: hypothetical protein IKW39_04210 [Alphaproteobacteria bacterium]|nr:hypothetical protein [Alphaproteobacteria bacterium]
MKKRHVKTTTPWSEIGVFMKNIGAGKAKNSENFLEYVFNMPMSVTKLYDYLSKAVAKYAKNDVSEYVFQNEDDALFDKSCSAIDIILRHLKELDLGTEKVLWCYLDTDKKAVVHFINKKGWYAEVYFLSQMEASFIHLVEDEAGHKTFIPVLFTNNISKQKDKVGVTGGICLQDYLPRTKYDFLSKKHGSKKDNNPEKATQKIRTKDNVDSL